MEYFNRNYLEILSRHIIYIPLNCRIWDPLQRLLNLTYHYIDRLTSGAWLEEKSKNKNCVLSGNNFTSERVPPKTMKYYSKAIPSTLNCPKPNSLDSPAIYCDSFPCRMATAPQPRRPPHFPILPASFEPSRIGSPRLRFFLSPLAPFHEGHNRVPQKCNT